MKHKITLFLAQAVLSSVCAETLINYTSSGSEVHARPADSISETKIEWSFSTDIPLIDASGFFGVNGRIYGGGHIVASGNVSTVLRENQNGFLNVAAQGDPARSLRILFFWQEEDFLTGGPVQMNSESSMTVDIRTFESESQEARFLLRQADQFFISDYTAEAAGVHSITNPASVAWAPFDPSDLTWEDDFRLRDWTNIQAAGLFASTARSSATGNALFNINAFRVTASPVPGVDAKGGFAFDLRQAELKTVVEIGEEGDDEHVLDGVYGREGPHPQSPIAFFRENTMRWCRNRWTLRLPLFPGRNNRIELSARFQGELFLKTENEWAVLLEGHGDRSTRYAFVLPGEAVGERDQILIEGALLPPHRPSPTSRETALALASVTVSAEGGRAGEPVAARLPEGPEQPRSLAFRLSGFEHRPNDTDIDAYAERSRLYRANVNYIGPMNGHHRAYFPTEHGFHFPTEEPDYIPRKIEALHRHGIAAIGWVPFTVQTLHRVQDYLPALEYPQWTMEFIDWPDLDQPAKERVAMCVISSPWRQIHGEVLKEVAALGVDGMFFDGVFLGGQPDPVAPGCICPSCQDLFYADTGLETPTRVDWDDMTFRRWVRWRNEKFLEIAEEFVDKIHEARPGLPVTFNWNTWPHATKSWETAVPLWARTGHGVSQHAFSRRDEMEWINLGYKARLSHDLNPSHSDIWRRSWPNWRSFGGSAADLERYEFTMRTFMLAGLSYGTTPWYGGGPVQPINAGIRVHEAVRKREHFFSQDVLRHIGVVVSQNTHDFYGHLPGTTNMEDYRDAVLGTWLLLTEQQAPFTLVFDNQLDAGYLAGFDLLLLSDTACLSEEMVAQIGQYVENGGRVVATGNAGAYDEWARPLQGNPLAGRAGMTLLQGEPGREWLRHRNQDDAARLLDALNPAEWPLRVDGPEWLVANAFWAPGQEGKTLWVHLLNVSMFYPGGDTGFRGVSSHPVYEEIFSRIHEPIGEIAVSVPGWSVARARLGISATDLAVSGDGSMMIPELDIHDVLILELEE